MSRYINLEKQLVRLYRLGLSNEEVIKQFLLTANVEDVAEVRHGRMVIEPDATVMHCNVCGWAYQYYAGLEEEWNYCPHCGAKMDGKE